MVFEIVVHVATLASVLLFYRERVTQLVRGVLARRPEALRFGGKLVLATLPAVVAALAFGDFLEAQFIRPRGGASVCSSRRGAVDHTDDASPRARLGRAELGHGASGWAARRRCDPARRARAAASRCRGARARAWRRSRRREFSFLMSVAAISGAAVWAAARAAGIPAPGIARGARVRRRHRVRLRRRRDLVLHPPAARAAACTVFAYYTWAAGLRDVLADAHVGDGSKRARS